MLLPPIRLRYDTISLQGTLFEDVRDFSSSHIDADVSAFFVANPTQAAANVRELYRHRTRSRVNSELNSHTRILLDLLRFPMDTTPSDTDCNRVLRVIEDYNVLSLLVEVLSEDDFLEEDSDFVITVLNIIYHVFLIAHRVSSSKDPRFIVLSSAFCRGMERCRLWFEADRVAIAGTSLYQANRQIRRALLPNILVLLAEDFFLATPSLLKLTLLYWITSPCVDSLKDTDPIVSLVLLQYVLAEDKTQCSTICELREAFRSSISQHILPTYGADRFLDQTAKMLRNEGCISDDAMGYLLPIVVTSITSHPALLTSSTLSDVLEAMLELTAQPPVRAAHRLERRAVFEFLNICLHILRVRQDDRAISPPVATITRHGRLFQVLSRGLCIFATEPLVVTESGARQEGYATCMEYLATFGAWALALNTKRTGNRPRKAMRHVLRRNWYPTLQVLRRTRDHSQYVNEHDRLTNSWGGLGDVLGIREDDIEAETSQETELCAWRGCLNHYAPTGQDVKTCKGCGEVSYCDRTCQRLDWSNGHRRECRRLGWLD
ncbi:unnamed protein product [Peniophora sp. CBMAI 1063]|nr:unnamed protein product [Peniophora sp. CBMAI 1063]